MSHPKPLLHLICGKIGAGKSTLAAKLAAPSGTVLISEDTWLAALFGDVMQTPADFAKYSKKLRAVVGPHVRSILNAGSSVVLDFQANTPESRLWMKSILEQTNADHRLHVLNPSDAECLQRLHSRNATGDHPFNVTDEQFHRISKFFLPPTAEEGFNLVHHN